MDPTARRRRTVLIAAITGGLILLLLIGVGVYGLIRGPQTTEPADPTPTDGPTATGSAHVAAEPEAVVTLGGPDQFAAAIAQRRVTQAVAHVQHAVDEGGRCVHAPAPGPLSARCGRPHTTRSSPTGW